MEHSFNTDIAKEYGILEAILLNNIWFWIKKNEANKENFYDGNYWTYNSTKAFKELFPYASQRQIQYALNHLLNEKVIKTGNYNKVSYDRTLWYSFTEKGKSIMQNCKMDDTNLLNGFNTSVKPIPDINTDINADINTDIDNINNINIIYKEQQLLNQEFLNQETNTINNINNNKVKNKSSIEIFESLIGNYRFNPGVIESIREWFTYKQEKKEKYTETGVKSLLKQLEKHWLKYGDAAIINLIDESMGNNYKGICFDKLKYIKEEDIDPYAGWPHF